MTLMAFSDSEVYNDKSCTKTCLKNYETLKKQCDDLIVKLNQTEFIAATYKRGLATVEEQLITYRKNEVLFSEEVAVLKREVACKDYEINVLKSEFEKVKQEKEGIEFKIEKFNKASKDLDKLLGSQITNKSKKGLRYNVVPPPHPLIYNRPKKLDLSYSGLDEFKEPEFKSYGSQESSCYSITIPNPISLIHVLQLLAITPEMTLSSTLIASENSLVCPLGSLVVVGSSRPVFTVMGQMANPFVVSTLRSIRPIMVIVALGAQSFWSCFDIVFRVGHAKVG
ncbi:hypothetical protein Tco_0701905 [Tanacetum coccineum]|uniref:Uncharacterized protein n=1 Tax=Tanacetum coccineum TaxID=301880 RepID=A0ABQ4XUI6_9ASTR